MTTETLSPLPVLKFWDNNGNPLSGGKLYTYAAGTTTPLATYTDSTGGTPNANPVILNARGECQVWIPSNTAYKFVLQDSSGNQIWAVDQITNAQIVTLYGGVDTGVVNAYVLSFVANFASLTDGIFLNWIPANSNTGASTININSLGVINIVNPDGSALFPNSLIANRPAQILILGGKAILLNSYSQVGLAICKYKTATTSRATNTTLAADPELQMTLGVGVYEIRLMLYFNSTAGGTSGGIQFSNAGSTLTYSTVRQAAEYAVVNGSSVGAVVSTLIGANDNFSLINFNPVLNLYSYKAFIQVTAAGIFSLGWAQSSSQAQATNLLFGSYMTVTRLA